jgi:hypothetical protein
MNNDGKHCECCGRKLHEGRMAWLEKSFKTNRWYEPGECPPDESQGCFPFGKACARNAMRDQNGKL